MKCVVVDRKEAGGAVAVSPGNIPPLIKHEVGVTFRMIRLAQNVFHGLNSSHRPGVSLYLLHEDTGHP